MTEKVLEANKRLERVIIFAGRKKTVKDLAQALQRKGIQAGAIHSDLSQEEREKQLHGFKSGNTPVIVATDVLSRGIDIKGIDAVINFDVPGDAEDYVHRIGRTARAEASGMAFTYINGEDMYRFKRIEELIERKVQRLPLPEELKDAKPQPRKGRGGSRGGNFRKGKKGGSHRGKGGGKRR
ncbi:MAG: C-terminal helicase domain-containing protein [bacterium]|nr:C-terminal helicase domain-containing protein [bacterium]